MTAPIVCAPVGSLPLDQVEGFPPAAARFLAAKAARTLADLEPYVAEEADGPTDSGAIRKALMALEVPVEVLDQAVFSLIYHLRPSGPPPAKPERKTRARKKTGTPPANSPKSVPVAEPEKPTVSESSGTPTPDRAANCTNDFDEHTPPPRSRPIGEPAPRYTELPRGEPCLGYFRDWDNKGRIPAGSVLCDFVSDDMGQARHSGYRVAAFPALGKPPLGPVGKFIPREDLAGWRIVATIIERIGVRRSVVVFARMEGRS